MIENIREEFVKILYETEWMDDVSRKHALEKVRRKKSIYVEENQINLNFF